MSDIGEACEDVFLDGCGRPWGKTPKPRVEDPWNWIPEFNPSGELDRYIRVRRGPKPPPDAWPAAPPPYETPGPRADKKGAAFRQRARRAGPVPSSMMAVAEAIEPPI